MHSGDLSRLTLTGFSYGGEGALHVASKSSLHWKNVWAVDPALQNGQPPPLRDDIRVWVHFGRAVPGGVECLNPLIAALGLRNWLPTPECNRVMRQLEADHVGACRLAFSDRDTYRWLSSSAPS